MFHIIQLGRHKDIIKSVEPTYARLGPCWKIRFNILPIISTQGQLGLRWSWNQIYGRDPVYPEAIDGQFLVGRICEFDVTEHTVAHNPGLMSETVKYQSAKICKVY